jgi:hypothetical protein
LDLLKALEELSEISLVCAGGEVADEKVSLFLLDSLVFLDDAAFLLLLFSGLDSLFGGEKVDLDLLALELMAVELGNCLLSGLLVVVLHEGLGEALSVLRSLKLARDDGVLRDVEEVENFLLGYRFFNALNVHVGLLVILGLGHRDNHAQCLTI